MHQIVSHPVDTSHRWWVLATVVAAQFMFGVDAFIVNVAIPTIAAELHASAAQIEAVIAIYLIAYATLVVTGGRLGDIYGARNVFISGVAGFAVTSLWCGLAQSGPELIAARLAQGALGCATSRNLCPADTTVARHVYSGGGDAEWCRRADGVRLRSLDCHATGRIIDQQSLYGDGVKQVIPRQIAIGFQQRAKGGRFISGRAFSAAPARGWIFRVRSCCLQGCCA